MSTGSVWLSGLPSGWVYSIFTTRRCLWPASYWWNCLVRTASFWGHISRSAASSCITGMGTWLGVWSRRENRWAPMRRMLVSALRAHFTPYNVDILFFRPGQCFFSIISCQFKLNLAQKKSFERLKLGCCLWFEENTTPNYIGLNFRIFSGQGSFFSP